MTVDLERLMGLAGFRYALRHFAAASEQISRDSGVTQQQYQAMLAIKTWPDEALAIKDLAEQLLLTHHAAVQMVDRLAKAGLAVREPSSEDRRSVLVRLTPHGDNLLLDLAAKHLQEIRRQEPLISQSLKRVKQMRAD